MSTSFIEMVGAPTNPVHTMYKLLPNGKWAVDYSAAEWYGPFQSLVLEALASKKGGNIPNSKRPKGHFGRWYVRTDVPIDSILIEREYDTRQPNPSFQKRKHAGEIVIQPAYTRGKVRILSEPYADGGTTSKDGSEQILHDDFWVAEMVPGVTIPVVKISGTQAVRCSCYIPRSKTSKATMKMPTLHPKDIFDFLSSIATKPDAKLITEMMADLNDGTMDLLTELAEVPETIKLGVDTLRLFSQKGKNFRRIMNEIAEDSGDPRKLARLGDKIANARLLWRYGILPLSYTLEDVKNVLKEKFKAEFVVARKSGSIAVDMDNIDSNFTFSGDSSCEFKCFAKRALDPSDAFQQFQKVFGASLPRTAWELTPWSLVADWFTNTGDALLALSPMPNIGEGSTISWNTAVSGVLTDVNDPKLKISVSYSVYTRRERQMTDNVCVLWDPVITRNRIADGAAFSWQIIRRAIRSIK